ncbi:MAG TPA: hypothetical protein VMH83_15210 [Candidatus Acidoferrum sp.]|nr:hypothetical protein [Candidatus Acidoferrum sp.]
MILSRAFKPAMTVMALALGFSGQVHAQKPAWTPIAELLVGSISEADPRRMSTVMSRCTALNMALAGLAPERSQHIRDEALRFAQRVIILEARMEKEVTKLDSDIDALSATIMERVKGMVGGYHQWMDHNSTTTGVMIDQDMQQEMSSCQLASRFLTQTQKQERLE